MRSNVDFYETLYDEDISIGIAGCFQSLGLNSSISGQYISKIKSFTPKIQKYTGNVYLYG